MFVSIVTFCVVLSVLSRAVLTERTVCDYLCDCHSDTDSLSVLCSRKSLSSIPQDFPQNVTNLDLSINYLPVLDAHSFPHLPLLTSLNLQQTRIQRLEGEVFVNLPGLQELQLNHNAITDIDSSSFLNSRSIHLLSLDHNKLESLSGPLFAGLRLESLSLQNNNRLTGLSPFLFHNCSVEVLSLDRCNLSGISPTTLAPLVDSLHNLMLSYNFQDLVIEPDTFAGFNFKMLNLIQDGLTSLDFLLANFTVQNLDLSYNSLGTADLSYYVGLHATETLIMKGCNLSLFTASSVTDLHLLSLHKLDISQNKLVSLEPDLFHHMSSLKTLTVTGNLLTSLPSELKPSLMSLEMLDVYGMPLECDCRLDWFRRWIQSSTSSILGAHCSDGVTDLAHAQSLPCRAPRIKTVQSDANGSNVNLWCSAEGIPTPLIYWLYTDSVPLETQSGFEPTWELVAKHTNSCSTWLRNVRHCVSVQCVAQNVMGKDYKTYHACIPETTPTTSTTTVSSPPSFPLKSSLSLEDKIGWAVGGGLIAVTIAVVLVVILHEDVRQHFRMLLWRRRPMINNVRGSTSEMRLVQDSDDEATFVLS